MHTAEEKEKSQIKELQIGELHALCKFPQQHLEFLNMEQ